VTGVVVTSVVVTSVVVTSVVVTSVVVTGGEVLLRVSEELVLAATRAEVDALPVVIDEVLGRGRIDCHAADRISDLMSGCGCRVLSVAAHTSTIPPGGIKSRGANLPRRGVLPRRRTGLLALTCVHRREHAGVEKSINPESGRKS
jgi:hypothetical protein